MSELPVYALRPAFERLRGERRLVLSSPTGSGKSTEVPRWFEGRVAVVEPRRVACRALAQRVAELEGSPLGGAVGYRVRDERRAGENTRLVFATPGIVLRAFDEFCRYDAIVLDEFHERGLEVDLLLGLLLARFEGRLLVMSATLDGDRVAAHLGGPHLRAEGRAHPVEVRHLPGDAGLPDPRGLDARLERALEAARGDPGDVLVFLPGKAEIAELARALAGRADLTVVPLHGDLSLDEQRRAFAPSSRRKIIASTNVAETSLTIPGVGVVIDAGLVRQTRYHQGRGHLALVPIAQDSADQRAGRAGRTGPGVAYRLWGPTARLAPVTPPEVQRESLVPLVLGAAACGHAAADLPLLDPPKAYALAAATDELRALGALDATGRLTARGAELFALPLDPPHGRLLIEARRAGCLEDAVDLVAALSVGRPLFLPGGDGEPGGAECDATALVRAVRAGDPADGTLHRFALESARLAAARLRRAEGLPARAEPDAPFDRERLARAALAADPRCAHVARRRGGGVAYGNGGTELELGRESRVRRAKEPPPAVAVLATRAASTVGGDATVFITCATPLSTRWMVEAGLGRDRLAEVRAERGRVLARVERVYAGRVLEERDEVPRGAIAREAVVALFARGSIFRPSLGPTRERLAAAALWAALAGRPGTPAGAPAAAPTLEQWAAARVEALGVESGDDLALLSDADFLAPDLPPEARAWLDRDFPRTVNAGDAVYEADYDVPARKVTLRMVRGSRRDPPPPGLLPRFAGFRVAFAAGRKGLAAAAPGGQQQALSRWISAPEAPRQRARRLDLAEPEAHLQAQLAQPRERLGRPRRGLEIFDDRVERGDAVDLLGLEREGHLQEGLEEIAELVALAQALFDREAPRAHLPQEALHLEDRRDDAVGDEDAHHGEQRQQRPARHGQHHEQRGAVALGREAPRADVGQVLLGLGVGLREPLFEQLHQGHVVARGGGEGVHVHEARAGLRLFERPLGLRRREPRALGRRGAELPDDEAEHGHHAQHDADEQAGVLELKARVDEVKALAQARPAGRRGRAAPAAQRRGPAAAAHRDGPAAAAHRDGPAAPRERAVRPRAGRARRRGRRVRHPDRTRAPRGGRRRAHRAGLTRPRASRGRARRALRTARPSPRTPWRSRR